VENKRLVWMGGMRREGDVMVEGQVNSGMWRAGEDWGHTHNEWGEEEGEGAREREGKEGGGSRIGEVRKDR